MTALLPILIGACVTVGFILLFASGQYKRVRLWRAIGSLLLALPAASLTYMFLGIRLARVHGLSRFYSWPVGGAAISDGNIGVSLLFWVAVWFVVLFAASNLLPVDKRAIHRRREMAR